MLYSVGWNVSIIACLSKCQRKSMFYSYLFCLQKGSRVWWMETWLCSWFLGRVCQRLFGSKWAILCSRRVLGLPQLHLWWNGLQSRCPQAENCWLDKCYKWNCRCIWCHYQRNTSCGKMSFFLIEYCALRCQLRILKDASSIVVSNFKTVRSFFPGCCFKLPVTSS